MTIPMKAAFLTLAIAGAATSLAGCVIGPGGGEVAFGYNDGYWDRDHHWHGWESAQQAARFRDANGNHFYNRRHDQDREQGWNDNDRYWERR